MGSRGGHSKYTEQHRVASRFCLHDYAKDGEPDVV